MVWILIGLSVTFIEAFYQYLELNTRIIYSQAIIFQCTCYLVSAQDRINTKFDHC